jgi:hypothetical protein
MADEERNTAETTETVVEETNPASAETENTENTGEGKSTQYVPYERFKEVNSRMKKAEETTKEYEKRLADLEQRVTSSQTKPGEKARYEDPKEQAFYERYIKPVEDANKAEVKGLREEIEFKNTEIQIQKELTDLQGKYPKMNRRDVYVALLDKANADKSIEELAKASHEDRESFAKQVIEDYRKTKKGDTPATLPDGQSPAVATGKPPKEAKTLADRMKWASNAAKNYLSNLGKK